MIHFACPHCRKRLFSQSDFATLRGPCPDCKKVITVPAPASASLRADSENATDYSDAIAFEPSRDKRIIDMELGPEPHSLTSPAPAETSPFPKTSPSPIVVDFSKRFNAPLPPQSFHVGFNNPSNTPPFESEASTTPLDASSSTPIAPIASIDTTHPCPICAERIQKEARRCRFCGAIFDDALRVELKTQQAEEQDRLGYVQMIAMYERTVNVWRSISIIALTFTIGWIFYLSLTAIFSPMPPWPAIIFNAALLYGLYSTSREIKKGPPIIFIMGAVTLILCMPINMSLGMLHIDDEMMAELAKRLPPPQHMLTKEHYENGMLMIFSFVGFLFSIPLWITAMKVASLERIRTLGKTFK